jgi:hypothetical protein
MHIMEPHRQTHAEAKHTSGHRMIQSLTMGAPLAFWSTMTADQQFLARSAERSTSLQQSMGTVAVQSFGKGFRQLMSFILKLAELQTYHDEATRLRGLAMPSLPLSRTSNRV